MGQPLEKPRDSRLSPRGGFSLSPDDDRRINLALSKAVQRDAQNFPPTTSVRRPRARNGTDSVAVTYIRTDGTIEIITQALDKNGRIIDEY